MQAMNLEDKFLILYSSIDITYHVDVEVTIWASIQMGYRLHLPKFVFVFFSFSRRMPE